MIATGRKENAGSAGSLSGICREEILTLFARRLGNNRLAHAYLFAGAAGTGKKETAIALAKLVQCGVPKQDLEFFCGTCPSCQRIDSFNHPDVKVIDAEGGDSIKIAAIRDLIQRSQLRPYEGVYKVFIILEAEDLTIEGANALLKTLEEPSPQSLLILTATAPEKMAATIRSRCQLVRFSPMPVKEMAAQLREKKGWDEEQSLFFSRFSEGALNRALSLEHEGFFRRKNEIIDNMVFARNNEPYLKTVLSEKERTDEALEVLLSWFRDLLLLKADAGHERLIHVDRRSDLERLVTRYTFRQVEDIMAQIINTARLLDENLNVKIAITLLRDHICLRS